MRTLALAAFTLATVTASAQIAPPNPGILMNYHYWPEQFVQFVGPELPYSMIAVEVAPGKKPVVAVTLTGRSDHNRIVYSDSPTVVAAAKAQGMEAHQTALAWEEADTQTTGSTSTLRMTLADGKPLEWRFVQGSDVVDQGGGLTAIPEIPIPVLAYREQAAVAGEGTALRIGAVTSAADLWKEISQPPYFIAYHGALSVGAHTLTLAAGKESFTVTSPTSLAVGSAWEFTGEAEQHRTLKITKVDGPRYTMDLTDTVYPSIHTTLLATRTADAWQVDSLRFAPNQDGEKHFLTVSMNPATLDVTIGKKNKIASATLATLIAQSGPNVDHINTLTMQTPTWAKGKTLTETSLSTPTTQTTTAHP